MWSLEELHSTACPGEKGKQSQVVLLHDSKGLESENSGLQKKSKNRRVRADEEMRIMAEVKCMSQNLSSGLHFRVWTRRAPVP